MDASPALAPEPVSPDCPRDDVLAAIRAVTDELDSDIVPVVDVASTLGWSVRSTRGVLERMEEEGWVDVVHTAVEHDAGVTLRSVGTGLPGPLHSLQLARGWARSRGVLG
jgi:hypothetical protein